MQTFAHLITTFIHFFYRKIVKIVPLFEKIVSTELFRYAACGGGNMVLDWILYFIFYHFIFRAEHVYIGSICISSHIAAFLVVFPITLFTGFWLNKYVTFTQSSLRGRKQLIRYIFIVVLNIFVNYLGLKLFVDICGFYPTPSKILVTLITVVISYLGQKYYSFKK